MKFKNKLVSLVKYRGIKIPKSITDPSEIDWPAEWQALHYDEIPKITRELNREMCKQHTLYKIPICALGRKTNSDDYFFQVEKLPYKFAWVHLTWNKEKDSAWPSFHLYAELDDWLNDANKEFK